ncbi:hypothetical protein PN36_07515 [Candidatus Thiomargarita nelsonii]|uniref:Homing endonuclease LAGLIDADG domain-containing protein n=1 Tax=Candidatus Thiomargarita nelsonii TaxID=1003181 RepID=A0A0A6PG30_9GAMM|nr:hypothetical protein PN36_07515 [Candidatus Thiomargarita nelsonii]
MDNHYIAGFVDGEGSFHVAFQKNLSVRLGWQAVPEFQISQNWHAERVLQLIQEMLDCGYIKQNHIKNERDRTLVFVVRNRNDLLQKIIPFFDKYPLYTEKKNDFIRFKQIVKMMDRGDHLSIDGFSEIVELAYSMNANGSYRKVKKEKILTTLKSSEAIR